MHTTSLLKYNRRDTCLVKVGNIKIGNNNPVSLQTMTNTQTSNIIATTNQVIMAFQAGADIVRITAPSMRDIKNIAEIYKLLKQKKYQIPLVADIHFNQKIAFEAAKVVEKIRINPGNFADSKNFKKLTYTSEEYNSEIKRIKDIFLPLVQLCQQNNTTLRIGTNHGSLSDRIMTRYGDTPEGMAESAMEFLRICKEANFDQVVISMKASNTRVMVYATRLLVEKMNNENIHFPLHLGVTEAGEGEDGRIKSAVGIGTMLVDGIGDTIRVSLTEPPENEIPVARKIVNFISSISDHNEIKDFGNLPIDFTNYKRRKTNKVMNIGGNTVPIVVSNSNAIKNSVASQPDYYFDAKNNSFFDTNGKIISYSSVNDTNSFSLQDPGFIHVWCNKLDFALVKKLSDQENKIIVLESNNKNRLADFRAAIFRLINFGNKLPVIIKCIYDDQDIEDLQLKAAIETGGLFIDGLADGIWLESSKSIPEESVVSTSFGILQACRTRMVKPDYISCPSCGRTMFNLQDTTKKIREKTFHLKGLKIGIMGCIVNGLGEMADADYGYIGAGPGKVNLYFNKELIKRGIKEDQAVEELIKLIKEKGDWIEP
jgi:(E)-4-hydroxy-3-methylbut-2-enyl-diphosphate synthase